MFFNEVPILEIRLNELYDVVDKFILIESETSHSGSYKPLYYNENKLYFDKYKDKIIHEIIDLPNINGKSRREIETIHRISILDILKKYNVKDNDIIISSDIDEILYKNVLEKYSKEIFKYEFILFNIMDIKFFLNNNTTSDFTAHYMSLYKNFTNPDNIRKKYCCHINSSDPIYNNFKNENRLLVKNSGLHLSSMGSILIKEYKKQHFSHPECDDPNNPRIQCSLNIWCNKHNNESWRIKNNFYNKFNKNDYYKLKFDKDKNIISNIFFDCIKKNYYKYEFLFYAK